MISEDEFFSMLKEAYRNGKMISEDFLETHIKEAYEEGYKASYKKLEVFVGTEEAYEIEKAAEHFAGLVIMRRRLWEQDK